jgi:hypothetical protein
MDVIRTILIIIIIYYVIKFVSRYILPVILNNYVSRKMNEFSGNQGRQHDKNRAAREGEVIINDRARTEEKKRKDRGEYVDYEEIRD